MKTLYHARKRFITFDEHDRTGMQPCKAVKHCIKPDMLGCQSLFAPYLRPYTQLVLTRGTSETVRAKKV